MNHCTGCESDSLAPGEQLLNLEVGERSFEGLVRGWSCAGCGERYYEGKDLQEAARWLAEHGVRTPAELKFMRKAAGIRAVDLAAWLGVTPETISHWETGKHTPDVVTRMTIAALVVDALNGTSLTRDRLEIQGKPEATRRVRLARDAA
jgi:DNA-binding transcriptional regulator YiaG